MNKAELVAAMAKEAGLTKVDAEKALKAFTDTVSKELKKKGKVQLIGFGTFETRKRAARTGRNPQTGKDIKIAAEHILKIRGKMNRILAANTGQPLEKIEEDTDRDNYLDAEEAVAYGLADKVVEKR